MSRVVERRSLVPQLNSTPTIKSVGVTFETGEATVTVETEEAIHGTMNVLLDGSNVPRLVRVVFGEPSKVSKIGTVVVSSGSNGILPEATYTHRNSTLSPFPPPVVHFAHSVLKDYDTTDIHVRGKNLEEGMYWMLVENGENKWNITLTRSNSTNLIGTAVVV
ncbi:hypothetical protein BLNAU_4869 [Blattamonas nauphoetae]|uniref:Uncharacterized protein n=1 Tax=Blattamonas nauphoetae TaxID=2049346 RepID=A0ABQ9Y993_9EUKA|nr:hypothetical protein BLNAU_4869 [Blattamonas nauphoetae]